MLKRVGYTAGGFVLIGVLALAILWGLSVGTVQFSLSHIFNIVMDQFSSPLAIDDPMNGPEQTIIWLLRMPRLLMAAVIGAGLAVSGVIMQAIVKNPLADPYILGISSGASLGATVAILCRRYVRRKFRRCYGLYWSYGDFLRCIIYLQPGGPT